MSISIDSSDLSVYLKYQGTNGKLYLEFGLHPNFWKFLRCCSSVFLKAEADIMQLLFASQRPRPSPLYNNLKTKREQLKANWKAQLITLEEYLAAVGAISLATGRKKVEDEGDYPAEPSVEPLTGNEQASITYIAAVTPDETIANLPWPVAQPLVTIPEVEPSTQARSAVDPAVVRAMRAQRKRALVGLSTSLLTKDTLAEYLTKHDLGLRMRASILGDGNCWWRTVADLIQLLGLKAPSDPAMLRKMVVATLPTHPNKVDWALAAFNGKLRKYNQFVKSQTMDGTWTDKDGILVVATADYLGVDFHIAGDQNCEKNNKDPILKVEGRTKDEEASKVVLHVGYYQVTATKIRFPSLIVCKGFKA